MKERKEIPFPKITKQKMEAVRKEKGVTDKKIYRRYTEEDGKQGRSEGKTLELGQSHHTQATSQLLI